MARLRTAPKLFVEGRRLTGAVKTQWSVPSPTKPRGKHGRDSGEDSSDRVKARWPEHAGAGPCDVRRAPLARGGRLSAPRALDRRTRPWDALSRRKPASATRA